MTGEGYGERFGHYLAKTRSTEHSYNIKMHQLEDKIKKLVVVVVVVQMLSRSDVPYGRLTWTASALLLSVETVLILL